MTRSEHETKEPFWLSHGEAGEDDGLLFWPHDRTPLIHQPFELIEGYCTLPSCHCAEMMFDVFDHETQSTVAAIKIDFDKWDGLDQLPEITLAKTGARRAREVLSLVRDILRAEPAYLMRLHSNQRAVRRAMAQRR